MVKNGYKWCADWWTIEVLKLLFLGEEVYLRELPPRRLRNNPSFSSGNLVIDGQRKLQMLQCLRGNTSFSDTLVVCEVGRGIDILLSSFAKSWKNYIVYDSNPVVVERVKTYFEKLGFPLEVNCLPSNKFSLPEVRPLVVVANNTKGLDEASWLPNYDKNILFIQNGGIVRQEARLCSNS